MDEAPKKRGRPAKTQTIVWPSVEQQAAAISGKFACRVERDYWPEEDQRVRVGTIVYLDAADAMDGIESGVLSRVR